MAPARSVLLSALAFASSATAQDFGGLRPTRGEGAFTYVQPLNTTILGPYGHSPAVLPSRELFLPECYMNNGN